MKCFVLAGGKGDRLWPLSRQHFPKQFIRVAGNHSLFQETIARNISFCDEFIVITNIEYQYIVENQMRAFQGITYRCVYEEVGRSTTAAVATACMMMSGSEMVLLVAADQMINGDAYRSAILEGKEMARQGGLVAFGMPMHDPKSRFGYIRYAGNDILEFTEKPDETRIQEYKEAGDYLINSGNFLFTVGILLKELKKYSPQMFLACKRLYEGREKKKIHITLPKQLLDEVPAIPIETSVFEKTNLGKVVLGDFEWVDVGELSDVVMLENEAVGIGPKIQHDCNNVTVLNDSRRQLVVTDGIEDTIVVATEDAVYVGKQGVENSLKTIIANHPEQDRYFMESRVSYRPWGTYELLVDEPNYRVKRIMIRETKTIYAHKHAHRSECWSIVEGKARITLEGEEKDYQTGDCINVERNTTHQITNIGDGVLHMIEVSMGDLVNEDDMISIPSRDLTEKELGLKPEPFVKMQPVFKDYLWGGDWLKTLYHKQTDLDIVAESWELSAHDAGQSIVASGRHKGVSFGNYLDRIGRGYWGWKCQNLPRFPILIKLIDARDNLSIQVHPDDEYALEKEQEYGKNEMWYVIDCKPGAGIYCGFNRDDVTKEEVEQRVQDNTILEILNWIPAKKGDVFFIKAGTVHAIGKGMLICEIQQSSNCTYRLYDYDRRDRFGNPRELHLQKALDVINYEKYDPSSATMIREGQEILPGHLGSEAKLLGRCKYFESFLYEIDGNREIPLDQNSFISLLCLEGSGAIMKDDHKEAFSAGESFFLPTGEGKVVVEGSCKLVATHI